MIVFLYGSDSYRLKQAKEEIISRYKAKYSSGVNLFYLDLSETADMDILESALKSSSFFNEHKLVVCKNTFNKKQTAEILAKDIKEYDIAKASDITLIAAETQTGKELAAKNKAFFNILADKNNLVREIESLSGEKFFEWIEKEFKTRGCSIEPAAARSLVNMAGTDSWGIVSEIDKLTAYKAGEITSADVADLVTPKIDLSIFDLIDALGNKDRRKSVELLYRELKSGRDPYYILTMIIYQFRNILNIKGLHKQGLSEAEIIRKSKFNPFVVKKCLKSRFETAEAVKTYGHLLALDTSFKSGRINLADSLYSLAIASY